MGIVNAEGGRSGATSGSADLGRSRSRLEDETEVPGAGVVVRVRHALEPLPDGGTRVTYSTNIDGPEADTLGPEIGPNITPDFPEVLSALIARAEATEARR